jgi:GxxExxY protein
MLLEQDLSHQVIGAAIEVHRLLGPGLLESVYELALAYELTLRGLSFVQQVDLPLRYKGKELSCGFRLDMVVERTLLLELKAVERVLAVHEAQLLTYLRLSGIRVGLLLNVQRQHDGAGRFPSRDLNPSGSWLSVRSRQPSPRLAIPRINTEGTEPRRNLILLYRCAAPRPRRTETP